MPWHETDPVDERLKFVAAWQRRDQSMTELCASFGISRKTGYKLVNRYVREGPDALRDRSRAPYTRPNQCSPEVEAAVLQVRKTYPTWGSKKILSWLEQRDPFARWPARSTVDAILTRAGVVCPKRKRARRRAPSSPPVIDVSSPNDAWSIDYKGWFRVGDGTRCDPLTINDMFSRASLACEAMVSPKLEDVKCRLEDAFWQFGLPNCMLSDNGPPFGSVGLGGLSQLSVWLLRLGVRPVFIQPGRPDQNGQHERFHRTLKEETASPPRATISAQQRAFTAFQAVYNEERPHEALDMRRPAELYEMSARAMTATPPEHEYVDGFEVRRVRRDGTIKWAGGFVFVGQAMCQERVGLEPIEDGVWHVHLGPMRLGALHERSKTVLPLANEPDPSAETDAPDHDDA